MIEILDNRRVVVAAVVAAVLLCVAVCALGALVSPRSGGEPLVLKPELRAALEFERSEAVLYARLAEVRSAVRYALDARNPLLARSNRLEHALQVVMDVHSAAERMNAPLAYQKRKSALLAAAREHGELIRLAAEWLNEPDDTNRLALLRAFCALDEGAAECVALTPTPTPTPP